MTNKLSYLFVLIIGLLALTLILFITKDGIGIFGNDSLSFLSASSNFLNGNGLSVYYGLDYNYEPKLTPLTQFPPLFPLLLASTDLFRLDPIEGIRWLNALLFGANIILIGFIFLRYTDDSIKYFLFIPFLFYLIFSKDILFIHTWALSEPLFIFLSLLGLFFLCVYIEKQKIIVLIVSSIIISLAIVSRYIGVVLIISGVIAMFFLLKLDFRKKVIRAMIFSSISFSLLFVWIIRNKLNGVSPLGRSIELHLINPKIYLINILKSFSGYLFSNYIYIKLSLLIVAIIIMFIMISLVLLLLKNREQPYIKIVSVLSIYSFLYILFLYLSISFYDASTPVNNRILLPVYISIVIIFYFISISLSQRNNIYYILPIIIIIFISNTLTGLGYIKNGPNNSNDWSNFASNYWKQPDIVEILDKIANTDNMKIYSNLPEGIYFKTGKLSYRIPSTRDPKTGEINSLFYSQVEKMGDELKINKALYLYFTNIYRWLPREGDLCAMLPLKIELKTKDYVIYEMRGPK